MSRTASALPTLSAILLTLASGAVWAQSTPALPAASANRTQPVGTVEQRLSTVERMVSSSALTDLLFQVQQLQQEVQQLRGLLEEQIHNNKSLKQRQRDLYLDMDRRMQRLEVSGTKPAPSPRPSSTPAQPPTQVTTGRTTTGDMQTGLTPTRPAADPALETSNYKSAFNMLKEGHYRQAVTAFQGFIADYPNGSYADNAQYWLGETHYVLRDFAQAIVEFNKVRTNFSDSPKIPDALLKIGYAQYELGQWEEVNKVLSELQQRFPDSTAARLAQKRLQKLKREGHI